MFHPFIIFLRNRWPKNGGIGIQKQTIAIKRGGNEKRKRFVVVGNGIAGISAAYAVRRLNKEAEIKIISGRGETDRRLK